MKNCTIKASKFDMRVCINRNHVHETACEVHEKPYRRRTIPVSTNLSSNF